MSKSQKPTGKQDFEITLTVVHDDNGVKEWKSSNKNINLLPGSVVMEVHSHPTMCGTEIFKPNRAQSGIEQARDHFDFLVGEMRIKDEPLK